jgi:glycosyltransferase involved in cell wall biosynthesis
MTAPAPHPTVDVNLFVHNGAATVSAAIESVLAQTWPALTLTLIDNGSTDATPDILAEYAQHDPRIRVMRNRVNAGPVLNCQRAFWLGDADYVMPKTADDLLAPDFIARVMATLLAHPECAMCHAAGLVFSGEGEVRGLYPPDHMVSATDPDPIRRATHVMTCYTSAPSFWGIYRRAAVNRLRRIAYRAGWDHAVVAELALYGEIRSFAEPLFWRRDGGKGVGVLARGCSEFTQRGLSVEDLFAEHGWRMPLISTAYGHIEVFALARLPTTDRLALMHAAIRIFRTRWLPLLQREAAAFHGMLPALLAALPAVDPIARAWSSRALGEAIAMIRTILPEQDFDADIEQLHHLAAFPASAGSVRLSHHSIPGLGGAVGGLDGLGLVG